MKKRFLVLAILTIFFVGCSSSSDGGSLPITEANVVGKWYLKGTKYNNEPFEPSNFSCATSKDFNEIFSNHRIVFTGYGSNCEVNDGEDNSWTLEGNTFTIIYDDPVTPEAVYQVIKLTDTDMQMKESDGGSNTNIYYLKRL